MAKTTTKELQNQQGDFEKRHAALSRELAELSVKHRTLMFDIKKTGTFFGGYRALKETFGRLDRLARRNGHFPEKPTKAAGANNAIFQKEPGQIGEAETRTARTPKAPPPNIFNREANRERLEAGEAPVAYIQNPAPPDLFAHKPPPVVEKKARKAPEPPPADPKRKVMASSADKIKSRKENEPED